MESKPVQKIYPTPQELSSVCSKVNCPQDNCKSVFQSTSNLNMHLIKHHKVRSNGLAVKTTEAQYFCPVSPCPYHEGSKKHFTKLKYVKQHYLKVHALKDFMCKKCGKKFSTESFRMSHVKKCGKLYTCTCGAYYTSAEAIFTHCKRKGKGHSAVEKNEKEIKADYPLKKREHISAKKTERFIYPKLSNDVSFPIHYIAAIALSELSTPCNLCKVVDKGVQTEVNDFIQYKDNQFTSVGVKCEKKRKNSQETQTTSGKSKKMKISTQTQTNSDYIKQKGKTHVKMVLKKRKKSMETQTKDHTKSDEVSDKSNQNGAIGKLNFEQKLKNEGANSDEDKARKWLWDNQFFIQKEAVPTSTEGTTEVKSELFNIGNELNLCGKELNLNEYNISTKSNNQYASEQGTDNQIFDLNRLCNIETQTEIDAFLTECNEDTTFTLCSTTETQTTDDFDSLLYSNMCTQTCEEVDQLFNFNFVHIETQTAWPDLNDCHDLDS